MSWKRSRDESRVKVLLHSVHQSTPERESFGAIKGTGFFLIRKADAVFVCQAIISMVLEVTFMVLGACVLKIIETGTTANLMESDHFPKMNASIASLAIWPFSPRVSATGSRPLLQCQDDFLGGNHSLALWCRCCRDQSLL